MKTVSDGYAKNYLLPRNFVKLATPAAMREREHARAIRAAEESERFTRARKDKEKIEALTMYSALESDEKGTVFGSIRKEDIAEYLGSNGIEALKEAIELPQPIKKIGDYTVPISLHPDVSVTLKISVTPPPQSSTSAESRRT